MSDKPLFSKDDNLYQFVEMNKKKFGEECFGIYKVLSKPSDKEDVLVERATCYVQITVQTHERRIPSLRMYPFELWFDKFSSGKLKLTILKLRKVVSVVETIEDMKQLIELAKNRMTTFERVPPGTLCGDEFKEHYWEDEGRMMLAEHLGMYLIPKTVSHEPVNADSDGIKYMY